MNIRCFHIGNLVVVADKKLSRANKLLGRIIEIFSGSNYVIPAEKVKALQRVCLRATADRLMCIERSRLNDFMTDN